MYLLCDNELDDKR